MGEVIELSSAGSSIGAVRSAFCQAGDFGLVFALFQTGPSDEDDSEMAAAAAGRRNPFPRALLRLGDAFGRILPTLLRRMGWCLSFKVKESLSDLDEKPSSPVSALGPVSFLLLQQQFLSRQDVLG